MLTRTELEVYQHLEQERGRAAADLWLRARIAKEPSRPSSKAPPSTYRARITVDWPTTELTTLLQRAHNREVWGQEAIDLAARLIGEREQKALGKAYPLVLLFVKGALEAHHRPEDEEAHSYHCFSNFPSLGVLCAAVTGRETSYNEKTIRRWLSPEAPHAKALRGWLGWRHWYTDTLLEYRQGIDPKTGEAFETGKSKGAVIGGTLFRVRLSPLEISDEQLSACNEERPSVVQPLKPELEHTWRDLELDRHSGRTWGKNTCCISLEEVDVRINEGRTKDLKEPRVLFKDHGKTHDPPLENVFHQNYLYPDIATLAGAAKLRGDVENSALWLMHCIEGSTGEEKKRRLLDRYRHAVWTAYKAYRFGETREGYELLLLAKRLAFEVRRTQNGIRDVGAYVWSVIEKRGFAELRRDYSYKEGRYLRVFSSPMARALGLTA